MKKRIAIIGSGNVGAHIASSSLLKNIPADFFLVDQNEKFEQAQVLDMKDILLFAPYSSISGKNFGDPELSQCDIFIITAGAKQQMGETRCSLLGRNVKILQSIKDSLGEIKPSALVIVVTNPVDVLTQVAAEIFNLPKGQVFGTGTYLDSDRLKWRLAEKFNRNILDIQGFVMGEHGDSEFVAWSTVNKEFSLSDDEKKQLQEKTTNAAYKIIEGKGSTYFGIGAVAAELISHIVADSQKILPLSCPLNGEYGINGISLGVPVKVGKYGISEVIELNLLEDEQKKLEASAEKLKASAEKLKGLFLQCSKEG